MAEGKVINSWEAKPFVCDQTYSSKMLLDDIVAGGKAIHINEGTLKGGGTTLPGAAHEATEIYYVVSGEAVLHLGDKKYVIKKGSIAYIPPGVNHALENTKDEDFVLLTLWEDTKHNGVYQERLKAWGTSFKTIDEE